jgi:hypothetical protein
MIGVDSLSSLTANSRNQTFMLAKYSLCERGLPRASLRSSGGVTGSPNRCLSYKGVKDAIGTEGWVKNTFIEMIDSGYAFLR